MSAVSLFPLSSSVIAVGDPAATRTVYLTTVALVLLGLGLAVLAWWLFRRTRPEPELFAPLEQMESRPWRKADPEQRQQLLDDARPYGARPVSLEEGADPDDGDPDQGDDGSEDDGTAADTSLGDETDESDRSDIEVPVEDAEPADDDGARHDEDASDREADDPTPATDPVERLPDPDRGDGASDGSDDSDPGEEAASDVDAAEGDDDATIAIDRSPSTSPGPSHGPVANFRRL